MVPLGRIKAISDMSCIRFTASPVHPVEPPFNWYILKTIILNAIRRFLTSDNSGKFSYSFHNASIIQKGFIILCESKV